jgi:hypothetical protein
MVTTRFACTFLMNGSIGARGMSIIRLQESRGRCRTRLEVHKCRSRLPCSRSVPFNGIGKEKGEEKKKGGGVGL